MSEGEMRPPQWSADEIRRVGYRAVDLIAEHLTRMPDRPVFSPVPAALADAFLAEPAPTEGQSADEILDQFERSVAPYPFGNGHPRFYGWVNSPPTVMGIFADALAAAMNPSVAGGNHAAVWVEHQVVNWFKALLGFPLEGMGLLVSGGSVAALTGLAVARFVAARRHGWDVRAAGVQGAPAPLVVYKGAEGHGCHQKAVELLGLGSANLRIVDSDDQLRISPEALRRAIREDLARGRVPMAVVASAGTVNTGAIDPLDEIADVCAEHGAWLHVDGAYGAPAILSSAYRDALRAIGRADSVAVDPHKWLYVPVEAGLVLVRDAQAMRDAFSLVPPYLRTDGNAHGVQGPPWFSEYGVQQTRGFRALKVWMSIKYHGLDGYRRLIEHDIALARHLAQRVREAPDLECWDPQALSIVCFRYVPPALRGGGEALDALNRELLTELQLGGGAFVSSTVLGGRFWLRACIVNHLARTGDVDALVALVREIGARRARDLT
jgi:aromatic-L-amino-acid/L-tryptophan decarboxylase